MIFSVLKTPKKITEAQNMLTPEEQERSADIQRRADEQAERRYLLDVAQYELMKKMAEAQGINVSSLNRNKSAYDGLYGATINNKRQ